jgi:hypothetical protein
MHAVQQQKADQFAAKHPTDRADDPSVWCDYLCSHTEALNAGGVRTARGGAWHTSTVRNLLARSMA